MTNFLGGGAPKGARRVPSPASALRIQQSIAGAPRPFGYGQARIAGNLIWYGAFEATPIQSQGGGGGKNVLGSGGKGGSTVTGYSYSASVAIGLSEGPIDSVIQGWANKTPGVPETWGFSLFTGGYAQDPWPYLTATFPGNAQSFRGLAYEAAANLSLGDTPELPNYSFEIRFAVNGAVTEQATIPGTPYAVTAAYFDVDYGVLEHVSVPFATPYTIQALYPGPDAVSAAAGAIAAGTLWLTTSAQGCLYDDNATTGTPHTPLTRGGSPGPGTYTLSSGGLYTFDASDAGQPIVLVDAALSPGVYYGATFSGTLSLGSNFVTGLSTIAGVAVDALITGAGVAPGSLVASFTGGSCTGTASLGSAIVAISSGSFVAVPGTPVTDSAAVFPAGTEVLTVAPAIVLSANAAGDAAADVLSLTVTTTGVEQGAGLYITVASAAGITIGATLDTLSGMNGGNEFVVTKIVGGDQVYFQYPLGPSPDSDTYYFTSQITGQVATGSPDVINLVGDSSWVQGGMTVTDQLGLIPAGTTVSSLSASSVTLTEPATANHSGDVLSFAPAMQLSQPATGTGAATLTVRGSALTQVLASPAVGQFTLSVQPGHFGEYGFAAADTGKTVVIMDVPDANPADVLYDLLTNPYYGLTRFPPARIGDLSVFRAYCQAAGLFCSPVIATQSAANQFVKDLMMATNSEIVWSGGLLTVVPYGDTSLSANGATYTPPSQPYYDLDDDDFLANQGTNSASVSASGSPDPVTVTRLDPATQVNDIQIEYLDRANLYNPTIVEAQDDAAINLFGLKSNGSKQLHLFCDRKSALNSVQLQLGRQQVRRTFSFTLDRKYLLLDPMDIVAITDANAGLVSQWVRITEITENDNRSLSITAEEYLEGTGSAPLYGHQKPAGWLPNYNLDPGDALAPIMFDAPVQLGNVLGMETLLATNGGLNWGGCDIWVSSDDVTFKYAGTLQGGTAMGITTAALAVGSDPDTVHTLAVDLTPSRGVLLPGTAADADQGNTLCLVGGELVAYQQATLTAQYRYDLGVHGASAGYLRRGFYATAIVSHASGAAFVRLREGSYFTIGYGAAQIGQTIHVKLLSFNKWGGGRQRLDQVTSYPHVLAAPPISSAGLLPGIIQTPDIALQAATGQVTANVAGPVGIGATMASIITASLATTGQLVQLVYNLQFGNPTGSTQTYDWLFFRDATAIDSGSITVTPGAISTIVRQITDTPAAATHVFKIEAQYTGLTGSGSTASFIDLSATELKR